MWKKIPVGHKVDMGVNYNVYRKGEEVDTDNLTYKHWSKSVRNLSANRKHTGVHFVFVTLK